MVTRQNFRFSIRFCFCLVAAASFLAHFVVEPEIRRRNTFNTLRENGVIGAPLVTMFGGRAPGVYDPVAVPGWFSARQKIANALFVKTEPWWENCTLYFDSNDAFLVELLESCDDLALYMGRENPSNRRITGR